MIFIPLIILNVLQKGSTKVAFFNLILLFVFINIYYIIILPQQLFFILFSLFLIYISALSILFILSLIKLGNEEQNEGQRNHEFLGFPYFILGLQFIAIELEYWITTTPTQAFSLQEGTSFLLLPSSLLNLFNFILYHTTTGTIIIILLSLFLILPIIFLLLPQFIRLNSINLNSIWLFIILLEILHLFLFIYLIYSSLDSNVIYDIFILFTILIISSIETTILIKLHLTSRKG